MLNLAAATYLYPRVWAELSKEGLEKNGRISMLPALFIMLGFMTVPNFYGNTPLHKSVLTWYLFSLEFLGFAWAMRARADAQRTTNNKA